MNNQFNPVSSSDINCWFLLRTNVKNISYERRVHEWLDDEIFLS